MELKVDLIAVRDADPKEAAISAASLQHLGAETWRLIGGRLTVISTLGGCNPTTRTRQYDLGHEGTEIQIPALLHPGGRTQQSCSLSVLRVGMPIEDAAVTLMAFGHG